MAYSRYPTRLFKTEMIKTINEQLLVAETANIRGLMLFTESGSRYSLMKQQTLEA